MNPEREITRIITKGIIDMIPPLPTMLDLMLYKVETPEISRQVYKDGYRNNVTGDGRCSKCMKPKKSHEFATPKGYICNECKTPLTRGADKNKRVKC